MIGLVDIGGTKLLAGVASGPGATLTRTVRRPTPVADPAATLLDMLDEARRGDTLEAVAMAVPGPFDRAAGRLINPPGLPPAWHGLDLREAVALRHRCPVVVENDANCAALAEARFGAAVGTSTSVYLTVSTGIGSGVVSHGRLLTGRHDTEGGHVVVWPPWVGGPACHCGGAGCLEALASGLAIERRYGVPAEEMEDQAAWDDVGRWLGVGVAAAIALHDPDVVVVGGGVTGSAARFWRPMTAAIALLVHLQPAPPVLLASLGPERNLIGALAVLVDLSRVS